MKRGQKTMKRPLFGNETRLIGYDRSIEAATPLRGNESCHFATMNRSVAEQRHALHGRVAPAMERDRYQGLCGVAAHARLSSLRRAACTIAARNPVADGGTRIAHLFAHDRRCPCKSKETQRCKAMKRRAIKAKKRVRIGTCPKQWNVTGAPTQHRRQQQLHLQDCTQRRLHTPGRPSRISPYDQSPALCRPPGGPAIPPR